jgi:hypothetical protein
MVAVALRRASRPCLRPVGSYQLRPLSTGEILDGSLTLLRRHFGLLVGIAVVGEGVPTAMDVYIDLAGGRGQHQGLALAEPILRFIGATLVTGATVRVVSEAYLGRTPRFRDALDFAGDKFGDILGANFVGGVRTLLALLALVAPGIILACGYQVASQVAALESPPSAGDSLRRSWQLTNGFKGKALVLWVVSICVLLAIYLGAGVLSGVLAALGGARDWAATLAAASISLFVYPLLSCVFTLFYYDLRVRKEGFDLEMLGQQLGVVSWS